MTHRPTIVVVGRPNVGKSLLFNRLSGKRQALVQGEPGMTLDVLHEPLDFADGTSATLVDTGGVFGESDEWTPLARAKMEDACAAADVLILVTDYRQGLLAGDIDITRWLRATLKKPWILAVNKAENIEPETACADFLTLGASDALAISAKHGEGLDALKALVQQQLALVCSPASVAPAPAVETTSVAVVGRPNVGKSSIINRLLKTPRMIVSHHPGTTRDSVSCLLDDGKRHWMLIDTAGMRRQKARSEREKFSVAAARRALAQADSALLVIDLAQGVTHQDKRIIRLIDEAGCAMVVAANKIDLLPAARRRPSRAKVLPALGCNFLADCLMMSAATPARFPHRKILDGLARAGKNAARQFPTAQLNDILRRAVDGNPPPLAGRFRPKLRYAHQGGSRPLCIVIHGSSTEKVSAPYRRYLMNYFGSALGLTGAPLHFVFRQEENPYV